MQRPRQRFQKKVGALVRFLSMGSGTSNLNPLIFLTFPRWRNARRSEGDDELQAAGGPPLLPDRDLERLRDDRLLHPLRLLAQHGHRHRSLRSRRILSCLGNLGKLFAARRFLWKIITTTATTKDLTFLDALASLDFKLSLSQ